MERPITTELLGIQPNCKRGALGFFVGHAPMGMPDDPGRAGLWAKAQREERAMSAVEMAARISGLAREAGDPTIISQQVLSKFEQGRNKRMPAWVRFIPTVLTDFDARSDEDPAPFFAHVDDVVSVRLLPNFAGMGGGGSDDGDAGLVAFSRDLIERELRAPPECLLAMIAEGNSMEPDFRGGDQLLVDTRRKSLAQPGAFCLWDGDGHVVKFLEKIPGSDPAKVRVISANGLYEPHERLVDEINLIGRVVWFGRRVQ